jgi:hypothetical protein
LFFNLIEAEILSKTGIARVVPFIAGIIEFGLCGMMFLMAAFALTGYLILSYNPQVHDVAAVIESYMGVLAVVAFVFGLAGSVSAIERWSLLLSVVGAVLIAFWGLLENWYSLTWLSGMDDIQMGVTEGTIAIFFAMLVIILVVATKEQFKPHALARAANS